MAPVKRVIRFKEWGVWVDTTKQPKAAQLASSDGTLEDDKFRLRTNTAGFILSGNTLTNSGSLKKIITLGGSFVESLYAHETDRFPAQLERMLNEPKERYEVWNGGYSGSTLLHSLNVFVNKVIPVLKYSEQVMLFTAMSDQRTLVHKDSYWLKDVTHAPVIDPRNASPKENREATTEDQERLLRAFVMLSRHYDHELILVASPYRDKSFEDDAYTRRIYKDPAAQAKALSKLRMINETARLVSADMGVTLLDAERSLHGDPRFFYDSMHLNSLGQEAMANFLHEKLARLL
ncbi:SGNH/GDSL hydrolase family protein [Glutamicibacter arilaitensis]|uniref:SGNH/GDSL hydrolase family protein n=1 Tax=Glutamicibacter arilaitensis TaxID=256701 RepID=UPI003FD05767